MFHEGLIVDYEHPSRGPRGAGAEAGWMDARPRSRAISALVQHAKAVFEERTDETALVAPISPSPAELIQTLVDAVSQNVETVCVLVLISKSSLCFRTNWHVSSSLCSKSVRVLVRSSSVPVLFCGSICAGVLEREHPPTGGMHACMLVCSPWTALISDGL